MPVKPARWLIILAFLLIYVVWGSSYIAIRFGIESIPPFLMAGVRFTVAGLLLIVWGRLRGAPMPTWVNWRAAIIAGGLLFLLNNSMIVWAQANGLPSGITAVMLATVPVWVVLINWLILHAQRPSAAMLIGIGLGLVGIVLLVNPTSTDTPFNPLLILSTLGAALTWAAGSLYARRAALPSSASLSTGMQLFTGGVLLLILSVVTGDAAQLDLASITPRSWVAFIHLLFSSSILAFSAYVWLIRVITPERAATYAYVNPVVAVFLGWLLAGEILQPITVVAAAIIIVAVFLIITDSFNRKERRERELPVQVSIN